MTHYVSFRVAPVPQIQAAILTFKSATYGSLELPKLAQLGADLADFAADFAAEAVILDLSVVSQHGAGFLNELIEFANDVRRQGVELVVSGDQTGLVQLVGGTDWCHMTNDLVEAMNWCASLPVAA